MAACILLQINEAGKFQYPKVQLMDDYYRQIEDFDTEFQYPKVQLMVERDTRLLTLANEVSIPEGAIDGPPPSSLGTIPKCFNTRRCN